MAQLVGSVQGAVNLDTLSIVELATGAASWDSPTRLRIATDADDFRLFDGAGLNYSGGRFISGTINRIIDYRSGLAHFIMEGFAMPAATFQAYVDAGNTAGFLAAVFAGNDILSGGKFNDVLDGFSGKDRLSGGDGNDTLRGGSENDTLTGGTGTDRLLGGNGDDIYYVEDTGDVADETGTTGYDYVISSAATYTLGAGVEKLSFYMETGLTQGTGNGLNNYIIGGDLGARLAGAGGNDTLAGGEAGDTLDGGTENDLLLGDLGNDSLIGGAGGDTLNGGIGTDTLIGGAGNDSYKVDSLTDVVIEAVGAGLDEITSDSDYMLPANVENLTLLSAPVPTNWDGTGNGLNNIIIGSNGNNSLNGAAGTDTVSGEAGNDTVDGGAGADSLIGGTGNDTYVVDSQFDIIVEDGGDKYDAVLSTTGVNLAVLGGGQIEDVYLQGTLALNAAGNAGDNLMMGNSANNKLAGGDGEDTMHGGEGNDTIDGGGHADVLLGGIGNDVYIVGAGDFVNEIGGSGLDTVFASVNFGLAACKGDVENLTLMAGSGNIYGLGNALANVIVGNEGDNLIIGAQGDDNITAGSGNDVIAYTGALDGHDVINGFDADPLGGQDTFNLDWLFDSLGVATADRAARVQITDRGAAVDIRIDVDGDGASFELFAATVVTPATLTKGDDVVLGTL